MQQPQTSSYFHISSTHQLPEVCLMLYKKLPPEHELVQGVYLCVFQEELSSPQISQVKFRCLK